MESLKIEIVKTVAKSDMPPPVAETSPSVSSTRVASPAPASSGLPPLD
jgi:hypothetical protein